MKKKKRILGELKTIVQSAQRLEEELSKTDLHTPLSDKIHIWIKDLQNASLSLERKLKEYEKTSKVSQVSYTS